MKHKFMLTLKSIVLAVVCITLISTIGVLHDMVYSLHEMNVCGYMM